MVRSFTMFLQEIIYKKLLEVMVFFFNNMLLAVEIPTVTLLRILTNILLLDDK